MLRNTGLKQLDQGHTEGRWQRQNIFQVFNYLKGSSTLYWGIDKLRENENEGSLKKQFNPQHMLIFILAINSSDQ